MYTYDMDCLLSYYIPALLSDEGVAAGAEHPNWVAIGIFSADGEPVDRYVAKVLRDGRMAAAEPIAIVAVGRCGVQADAGADAAAVVAQALQLRHRVAADCRELVSCRRDQELREVERSIGVDTPGGGAVAEGRHKDSDAYLAGHHRDVDDLDVAQVWSRRVEGVVATDVVVALQGTLLADAIRVGNNYIAAPVRAVRPWTRWQRRWCRHHLLSPGGRGHRNQMGYHGGCNEEKPHCLCHG